MKKYLVTVLLFITYNLFGQKAFDLYNYLNFDIEVINNKIKKTYKFSELGNETEINETMYGSSKNENVKEIVLIEESNKKFISYKYFIDKDNGGKFIIHLIDNDNFNNIELSDIGLSKINKKLIPMIFMNSNNVIILYINKHPVGYFEITTFEHFKSKYIKKASQN